MTDVDPSAPLVGAEGQVPLIDVFEGRSQLFVSYHMWHDGQSAADQCEGCTFFTGQALELSYLDQRDVTFAVFCQGPYEESDRYRRFMGWDMPWYSVPAESRERLLAGRHFGMKASYLPVDVGTCSSSRSRRSSAPGRLSTSTSGQPRRSALRKCRRMLG